MTKFLVFAVFFVVWLDGVFGLRLSLVPGLSAKNIVLYLVVIWIVLQGALDGSRGGLFARRQDYMSLHLAFIGFILLAIVSAVACLTLLRYPGYTVEFTLWTLKAYLIDHYLFMFVFLVGLRNADEARQLARLVLIAMAVGSCSGRSTTSPAPILAWSRRRSPAACRRRSATPSRPARSSPSSCQ
jgi:hypothetical protein